MVDNKEKDAQDKTLIHLEGKYLAFSLAEEEYCVEILKVKEIIAMMKVTKVPKTPVFVKGVINLRGKIIPIIDLRLKFNLDSEEYHSRTTIIIIEVERENQSVPMGIVVDGVSEVINIKSEQMEKPPTFGTEIDDDFILAMAKIKDSVKIILDINKILTADELTAISRI